MDTMHFEIGSVVQLRSGGPRMTVYATTEAGITVVWFEPVDSTFSFSLSRGDRMQQRIFPAAMLDVVSVPSTARTIDAATESA